VDDKSKAEQIAEEALNFFEQVTTERETPKSLSAKTGLSLKTVYNRINQGRDIFAEQIREMGKSYLANVWLDYERVKKAAWAMWEASLQRGGDVNFLKEYRAVLDAQRKILSIDAPAKAPVNENGETVQDNLILVFSDSDYNKKEIEYVERNNKLLEEQKLLEAGSSTEVPLTTTSNEVE
jgi:hypothetical protein